MKEQDMVIVKRVQELSERYGCTMTQVALAWHWRKGTASPIIGATKIKYLDDAASAFDVELSEDDILYLEEAYVPHPIVGAINKNPKQVVMLLDGKVR